MIPLLIFCNSWTLILILTEISCCNHTDTKYKLQILYNKLFTFIHFQNIWWTNITLMSFKRNLRDIWYLRVSVWSLSWLNTNTPCFYWWYYLCDLWVNDLLLRVDRLTVLNICRHDTLFWEPWWGGQWYTRVCCILINRIHFWVATLSKFAGIKNHWQYQ